MIEAYNVIHADVPPVLPTHYFDETVEMLLILSSEPETDKLYYDAFPELAFFRNSDFSIDTISAGNSKGKGVTHLIDALGLTGVPTYGFGDGPNDIPLLQAVDHGVAMANGKPETKAVAEYVTSSNVDGGLIQAFKHYGLL
jgi:hydroxymethylpyrimidine pyrophosphatase-like HAD family hydrolase